ncbi:MAG: 3-deoxy-manno-octulosonate cytidylyltransferase [Acidobacteria bacterium]|nr:3-deoxy-manno-octulosonate cytidylyltransferase [Acidobacteriota bacterium]
MESAGKRARSASAQRDVAPNQRVVGIIPARLDSERLPGKVLRPICGRPMLHLVYERASTCSLLSELYVATDSEPVRQYCLQNQIPVLMTAATHRSGTERIIEVMQKKPADVYVNVQGDEPMIQSSHLEFLITPFLSRTRVLVTTLKTRLREEEAADPNVVKVVTDLQGQALYFSRAPIPFHRNAGALPPFYKHLGLYAYSREALERYAALPPTPLEQAEQLEQLRFLEHGIPIQVAETAADTIGVDTEEDLRAVTRYFENLRGRG